MNRKNLLALVFFLSLTACGPATQPDMAEHAPVDLKDYLPGTWTLQSMAAWVITPESGPDSLQFIDLDLQKGNFYPAIHHFSSDRKFRIQFQAPDGSPADSLRGLWNAFGDTLLLIEPKGTYTYEVHAMAPDSSRWKEALDWDGDGLKDDTVITHLIRSK